MKNNEIARLSLIFVAACVFLYLINEYNKDNTNNANNNVEGFEELVPGPSENEYENEYENETENETENENENENENDNIETFYAEAENPTEMEQANTGNTDESDSDPQPSEGDNNSTFKTVAQENNNDNNNQNPNRLPNECYPRDVLTPGDLLPQDANSTWAQTVPNGQGNLGDQNFLNAGHHVGINTVGQSLRNANMQLRSEPANPQLKVSPWLQTTIEPDINRRAMEIGA